MAKQRPAPESGYTVLARRYRPQQFADLVGQEPVARALTNALKSNRVAHAYLFTGPRGIGKTTTARILAKALNCALGPTPTPCDRCELCRGIASGEDVDVLEIDGASNRGIDEVREIRGNVQYRPNRARYKIYIIDEVHMLTPQAFNALLKTLEEPPPHVKFIFATTEAQKIPITILSRCQRFDLAGIGTSRIVERLREVVKAEEMEADDEALELVARRAGGSMRDSQSLLDQLLSFGAERLTVDQVHQLLGTAHDDRILELVSAVLDHDVKKALGLLERAAEEGLQLGELLDQLIAYWRDLMVVRCAGDEAQNLSVASRHRETVGLQAEALKVDTILAGLDVLSTTRARLQRSNHGRTLLEMALVRLGRLEDLVALSQVAQWLDNPSSPPEGAKAAPRPALLPTRSGAAEAPAEAVKKKVAADVEAAEPAKRQALSEASLPQVWQGVLAQLGPIHREKLQKAGLPAISGPNALALRFKAGYNPLRDFCQEAPRLARVEELLRLATGQKWAFRIESSGGDGSAVPPSADNAAGQPSRYRRLRAEVLQEPLVKRALDVLEAQLVQADEGFGAAPSVPPERLEEADGEES